MKIKIEKVFNGRISFFYEGPEARDVKIEVSSPQGEPICSFLIAHLYGADSFDKAKPFKSFWVAHHKLLLYKKIKLIFYINNDKLALERELNYIDPHNYSNFVDEEQLKKYRKEGLPEKISFGCTELVLSHPYEYFKENLHVPKPVLLNIHRVNGVGDALTSTPTVRKLAKAYGRPICVISKRPEAFFNNPNIDKIFTTPDPQSLHEGYYDCDHYEQLSTPSWGMSPSLKDRPEARVPYRWKCFQLVEMYSTGLGFMLLDKEKTIEHRPHKVKDFNLKDYVVCNITVSSALRFWSFHEWNNFFSLLRKSGLKVAVIGHKEYTKEGFPYKGQQEVLDPNYELFKPNIKEELDISGCLDLTGPLSLNDTHQIIAQSKVLVTPDTHTLHLVGSTDTWLILIGGAAHPDLIMPYRYGSRRYKAFHVSGGCGIYCTSELKYCVKGKDFKNESYFEIFCKEGLKEPICQPSSEQVFEKIEKIYNL